MVAPDPKGGRRRRGLPSGAARSLGRWSRARACRLLRLWGGDAASLWEGAGEVRREEGEERRVEALTGRRGDKLAGAQRMAAGHLSVAARGAGLEAQIRPDSGSPGPRGPRIRWRP